MKKNKLLFVFLFLAFVFFTGCSKTYNIPGTLGSESVSLDKVVLEKNRDDCIEVMAIYFKGDNITKVETRETYFDQDSASRAYVFYSDSKDYNNLKSSGLDIGYEYSKALIYNTFDGIRGKDKVIDILQNERGYVLK